jgi:hypothetical protein
MLASMPAELQPLVQASQGALKSHILNKMLDASTETRGGNDRPFWYGTGVNKAIKNYNATMDVLMEPGEQAQIGLNKRAGDALSFDPGYPGAAAQAHNALKGGLMSQTVGKVAPYVGGTVGGAGGSILGTPGAAVGGAGGAMAGQALAKKWSESAAAKAYQRKLVPLTER